MGNVSDSAATISRVVGLSEMLKTQEMKNK
jgi:hypothetical protein